MKELEWSQFQAMLNYQQKIKIIKSLVRENEKNKDKNKKLYSTVNYFPETSSKYHKFEANENRGHKSFPISTKSLQHF